MRECKCTACPIVGSRNWALISFVTLLKANLECPTKYLQPTVGHLDHSETPIRFSKGGVSWEYLSCLNLEIAFVSDRFTSYNHLNKFGKQVFLFNGAFRGVRMHKLDQWFTSQAAVGSSFLPWCITQARPKKKCLRIKYWNRARATRLKMQAKSLLILSNIPPPL